jgi:glucan phosphoethanolaminetransferase (alkaline phosphatase superfamily)
MVLAVLAAIAQYAVLQMFAAGQRQGAVVVVGSFIFAMTAVYGMPYLTISKVWQFLICVLAPAIAACAVLLVAEKMERPEITVLLRPEGLKLAALTTVLAGGWLVGLAAFCGLLLAQARNTLPPTP